MGYGFRPPIEIIEEFLFSRIAFPKLKFGNQAIRPGLPLVVVLVRGRVEFGRGAVPRAVIERAGSGLPPGLRSRHHLIRPRCFFHRRGRLGRPDPESAIRGRARSF
jgi:hypothetical protein